MINKIVTFIIIISLSSCMKPVDSQHGYNFEYIKPEELKANLTNKEQVMAYLGNPSTRSSFGQEKWYYISFQNSQYAFLNPKQNHNNIITISFNEDDTIQDISFSEDQPFAKNIYDHDVTPIYGTKKNFIQRSLGNMGVGPSMQDK